MIRNPDGFGSLRAAAFPAPPVFHPSPTSPVDAFFRGRHKLRVLVVSAAPVGDAAPLDLRREWVLLQREAKAGDVPALFYRLLPPTRETFEQALKACDARGVAPHVFHFAGPGQVGDLAFEDALCNYKPYRREALAEALKGRGVRLAVLNACHTATRETVSLARYLQETGAVEAAIGHERPVPDDAAALFASYVYRGLCRGQTVLEAFAVAESALAKTHPAAARATVLYGGDHLRLGEIAIEDAGAPLAFDGTSGRGQMSEVAHFFGRAEELVEVGRFFDDTSMRVLALCGVGGIGKTTLATMPVEELEKRAANSSELAHLLVQKAVAVVRVDEGEEAKALLTKARAIAESSNDPSTLVVVLVNGAQVMAMLGDIDGARAMLAEARPAAQEHARSALPVIEQIELALRGAT